MKKDIVYLIIIFILFGTSICFGTLYFVEKSKTPTVDSEVVKEPVDEKKQEIEKFKNKLEEDGYVLTDEPYDNTESAEDIIYTTSNCKYGNLCRVNIHDKRFTIVIASNVARSRSVINYYWGDDSSTNTYTVTEKDGSVIYFDKGYYNFVSGTGSDYSTGKNIKSKFLDMIESYDIDLEKIK